MNQTTEFLKSNIESLEISRTKKQRGVSNLCYLIYCANVVMTTQIALGTVVYE